MTTEQLLQRAEECRMAAAQLLALALVTALTGLAVWFTLGPGQILLACIVVSLVSLIGAINERIDATHYQRRAWFR